MSRARPRPTDHGAPTTLGYALTLTTTVVLISGSIVTAGGFVSDEHERVTEVELDVVGNRLATDIKLIDRTRAAPGESRVEVRVRLPPRVAGTTYAIEVLPTSSEPILASTDPEVTIRVSVEMETSLAANQVDGGGVAITYDPSSGVEVVP